jgi:hypothetical protein
VFSKKNFPIAGCLMTLWGSSCGSEAPQNASQNTPPPSLVAQNPLLVQPAQGSGTSNPAEIFGEGQEAPKPYVPALAELPFQEISAGLPGSGTWIGYPLLFDFTGDRRADLVVSNREEDGYNSWQAPGEGEASWGLRIKELPRDLGYGPARAADFNSDGIFDLLISAHSDGVRLYLGDGKMLWKQAPGKIENPNLSLDVAVGNLNRDGHPDVVAMGHFEGGLGIYIGDGKGGLARLPQSADLLSRKVFGRRAELVDMNNDGTDDIVAATDRGLKVFFTQPGETLSWKESSAGLPAPVIGNTIYGMAIGDFVEGGLPEIAAAIMPDVSKAKGERHSFGIFAWDKENNSWTACESGVSRDDRYRDLVAGDLNKDGHLDLVASSMENGAAIYLGDGKGNFTVRGRIPGILGRGRIALGDINADGWLDFAAAIPATKESPEKGGVRAFLNSEKIWK